MRIIPVINLMNGQVVRAIAGRRSKYQPIESRIATNAQPATIAQAYVDQFAFDTVYVADLDAIEGRSPNLAAWKDIQNAGLTLWLDVGIATAESCLAAHKLLTTESVRAQPIVALESLREYPHSEEWIDARARSQAFIFSLDLLNGVPIHHVAEWRDRSPVEIARSVHSGNFGTIIVLDLAAVGTSGGTRTLSLCRQLVSELHPVRVVAGGGVRGIEDLQALANAGCTAALVASALHDGRLTAADLSQLTTDN